MFVGYQLDKAVKLTLRTDKTVRRVLEITIPGKKGPDFVVKATVRRSPIGWIDITTQKSWEAHVSKYTPYYGTGSPVFY